MAIIRVINGKQELLANVSITSHEQLQGRDSYGCHPISAIRKLPEKLHDIKLEHETLTEDLNAKYTEINETITTAKDELITYTNTKVSELTDLHNNSLTNLDKAIDAEISRIDTSISDLQTSTDNRFTDLITLHDTDKAELDSTISTLEINLTDSINIVKQGAQDINVSEHPTESGKLLFTDYSGNQLAFRSGYMPDNSTITLTDDDTLQAVAISDGVSTWTPESLQAFYASSEERFTDIIEETIHLGQELYILNNRTNGIGGYLNSYDFGKANLSQEDLTQYALQDIGISNRAEIFNGTKVINLFDMHVYMLTNTPESNPVVFSWQDLGVQAPVSVATDGVFGVVKSSYEELEGFIDLNGIISINGLQNRLVSIDNSIDALEVSVNENLAVELATLRAEVAASIPKMITIGA